MLGQKGNGQDRIGYQHPHHRAHNLSHLVVVVDPNPVLITGPKGTLPGLIVEGVFVILRGCIDFGTSADKAVDGTAAFR